MSRRQARVGHVVVAAVLVGLAAAVGLAVLRALAGAPAGRTRPPALRIAIDLATAPAWQLSLLPGIGDQRARAIVSQRLRAGGAGFAGGTWGSVADLLAVPGIGPGIVRRLQSGDLPVRVLLRGRPLGWAREPPDP